MSMFRSHGKIPASMVPRKSSHTHTHSHTHTLTHSHTSSHTHSHTLPFYSFLSLLLNKNTNYHIKLLLHILYKSWRSTCRNTSRTKTKSSSQYMVLVFGVVFLSTESAYFDFSSSLHTDPHSLPLSKLSYFGLSDNYVADRGSRVV